MRQFYINFYTKNIFSSCCYIEENFKNNETYQKFFGESAVRSPGKRGNVSLIHLMSNKPQIFTNAVLQCLVDKYLITNQNIWGEGMATPYLVASSYCKNFGTTESYVKLKPFPTHKKCFLIVAAIQKKNKKRNRKY